MLSEKQLDKSKKSFSMKEVARLIDSVARALRILSYLADNNEIGVRELSRVFKVNEATAFRTLSTLQELGYVIQDIKTKKYKLGFETVRLGQSCLGNFDLVQVARKYSIELSRKINETVTLMAKHGKYALYVTVIVFLSEREQRELIGDEQFAEVISQILVLRAQGYTISDEEVDSGVIVIGCPIYNYQGDIIGALNIPIPKIRVNEEKTPHIAEHLQNTAKEISRELGYRY